MRSRASQTIFSFLPVGAHTFGDAPFGVGSPLTSSNLISIVTVKSGPATIANNLVTVTGAGTVTLAANQPGNSYYAAASEVDTSFTVNKANQTINAFALIADKTLGSAPFPITIPSSILKTKGARPHRRPKLR